MNCIICGVELNLTPKQARTKYCPECRKVAHRERERIRSRQTKRKMAKETAASPAEQKVPTLEQVMRLASQNGMSYGQYVNKYKI